jgi:broad specificity phosphatase PhoE
MEGIMKRPVLARLLLFAFILFVSLPSFAQVTVIFSRHAERAATPKDNPPITEAGQKRAELLASMLVDSGIDTIYVSDLKRTQQTAAPLADRIHIKPIPIAATDTAKLIAAIRSHKSGVVLVIGHSDKIPQIIASLGGPAVVIPDTVYNNLYILTVEPTKSSLLQLHYGDSVPVEAHSGNSMTSKP